MVNYRTAFRQYSRAIYTADTVEGSVEALSEAAAHLGFEGVGSLFWPGSMKTLTEVPAPAVILIGSNMPNARNWTRNYIKSEMFKADFVYRACRKTTLPVVWSYDTCPQIVQGTDQRASMTEVIGMEKMIESTGFLGGISIPVHGLSGFFGYVTFASKEHLPRLLEQQEEFGDNLLGLVHRFYDAVADKLVLHDAQGEHLSARELECLTLLGLGKTLEETAEILNLSYSTIRFHLHNSERKLGTGSRAHAIAKAASMGLLGRID